MDDEMKNLIEQKVEVFENLGMKCRDLEFLRQSFLRIADIAFIKGKIEEQDKRIEELKQ